MSTSKLRGRSHLRDRLVAPPQRVGSADRPGSGRKRRVAIGLTLLLAVVGFNRSPSLSASARILRAADPPCSIDLAHVTLERVAGIVGSDPGRAFRFVRDHVAWEPYRGALRGPRGTLLALAGNSLDRALLLMALLSARGHEARLMSGTLPPELAAQLASTLFARSPPDAPSESGGEPSATILAALQAIDAALPATIGRIGRIGSIGSIGSSETEAFTLDRVAREASEHYWVQSLADGSWVDLDPTFPEAEVGTAFAKSGQPHPAGAAPLPFLIRLRIVTRMRAGETARNETVYEWKGVAMDLAGDAFVIEHVPARSGAGSTVEAVGGALTSALSDEGERLRPLVTLGGKRTRGKVFSVGASAPTGAPSPSPSIPGLDRFRRPAAPRAVADREWIEIEVTHPDGGRHQVMRLLHDATELADPVRMRDRVTVVSIVTGVPSRAHFPSAASRMELPAGEFEMWRLLRSLNLLLVAAPAAAAPGFVLPGERSFRYFIDAPQVIVSDVRVVAGRASVRGDLRSVSQRVVANFDQSTRGQALARVLRGVIDTRVEVEVFSELFGDGDPRAGVDAAAPVLDLVAAGPETLRPLTAAELDALPLGDAARDFARGDLESGYLLIGASHPVVVGGAPRTAWWRVDPRTGGTIGVLDTGLHQTGTEVAATDDEGDAQAQSGNAAYSSEMQRGTARASQRVVEQVQRLPGNHPVQANDYGAGPNLFEMPLPRRPPGGINTGDPAIRCIYPSRGPHDWWNALF